ncbi:hypothetical protein BJ878DRAFT_568630 [Calycina marina]|uniref:C3H1-type domain-containing protein n=1 Tax=Calycina marina TaxID=1763456 RepID=A0A9P7Z0N6_9HELO|nr:hypothetical protein BJ878DRAFT_568630 [Calycina marina]
MAPGICRFYQQGNCRNGANCRYGHPSNNGFQQQGQQAQQGNANPFNNRQQTNNTRDNGFSRGPTTAALPYRLDKSGILTDLKNERPQWILSAYGPGDKECPRQLFGGEMREQSPEEMRMRYSSAAAIGEQAKAIQEANDLFQQSQQQMDTVIGNVDGAVNYIIEGDKEHPNRRDICKMSIGVPGGYNPDSANPLNQGAASDSFGTSSQPAKPSTFGQWSQPSPGAFVQPPQPTPSPFGQPSKPAEAFGAPLTLGAKPSPFGLGGGAFGQPFTLGQNPSPFATQPAAAGGFGQPSTLGQNPSPFATKPAAGGGFGQPSILGQNPSPFATKPAAGGEFGQPSILGQNPSPFATQPAAGGEFGQPSTVKQNPSPFATQPVAGGFGRPSTVGQNPSPFATQPAAGGFGKPSGLGQTANLWGGAAITKSELHPTAISKPATSNTFGQPSQTTANGLPAARNNGFGQPTVSGNTSGPTPTANPDITHAPQTPRVSVNSAEFPLPRPLTAYATLTPDGELTTFQGRTVRYPEKDGKPGTEPWTAAPNGQLLQRIWCPKGFPAGNSETEEDGSKYTEEIEEAYLHLRLNGEFKDGVMPMVPPRKEWSSYEF